MNFETLFLKWILRGFILIIGSFFNLVGLATFVNKSFKYDIKLVYSYLAIVDEVSLIYLVSNDILDNLELNYAANSNISCKIYRYIGFFIQPISAWLLVFISIEKYFSIQLVRVNWPKKLSFQLFFILMVTIYNIIFYIPVIIFSKITHSTQFNVNLTNSSVCTNYFTSQIYIGDLLNLSILPFVLMIIFSFLLIRTIYSSRRKILRSNCHIEKRIILKDIKYSITSISLNIIFIGLNLPITVSNFFPNFIISHYNIYDLFVCMFNLIALVLILLFCSFLMLNFVNKW